MKKTDRKRISYPKGTSSEDRRFVRALIAQVANYLRDNQICRNHVVIGCSGGLDSTVLAHLHACARTIGPHVESTLVYVNHNLRTQEEIQKDIDHVNHLGKELNMNVLVENIHLGTGNVQLEARDARYEALANIACTLESIVLLAHHGNDIVESKLFQFLTGREVIGISKSFSFKEIQFFRPMLEFTRLDLERYAKIWNLNWSEDSSNSTDKYTRNKIRHHLIPFIEKEINPGVVKMLIGNV